MPESRKSCNTGVAFIVYGSRHCGTSDAIAHMSKQPDKHGHNHESGT